VARLTAPPGFATMSSHDREPISPVEGAIDAERRDLAFLPGLFRSIVWSPV